MLKPTEAELSATIHIVSAKLRRILSEGYTGEIKLHCKNGIIYLVERNVKEQIV